MNAEGRGGDHGEAEGVAQLEEAGALVGGVASTAPASGSFGQKTQP